MSFEKLDWFFYGGLIFILVGFFIFSYNKKLHTFVRKYWFKKPSSKMKLSSLLSYVGLALFLVSLGDLRGPEKKVAGDKISQRTLILIDLSMSMWAQDVKPSRYEKAIILARHFAKNAVGHDIAIATFSNTHRKVVPFTGDTDLLDARLSALKDFNLRGGGSNVSLALTESFQYFKDKDGLSPGNILLITDCEELEGKIEIPKSEKINLAIIGVGTEKGGAIPNKDRRGRVRGYKKFQGQEVISKLSIENIKRIGDFFKNFKYWIATSYTLPTNDILKFFSTSMKKMKSQGGKKTRPLRHYWLSIPALFALILSFLLRLKAKQFIPISFILLTLSSCSKPINIDEALKEGRLSHGEVMNLALEKLMAGDLEGATTLFAERTKQDDLPVYQGNAALSFYKTKNMRGGLFYHEGFISQKPERSVEVQGKANLLLALRAMSEQELKKQEQGESQDNQQGQQGEGQEGSQKKESLSFSESEKQRGKKGQKEQSQEQEGEGQKKEKKEGQQGDQSQEGQEKKSGQKEKKIEKSKVPGLIKQQIDKDKELQESYLNSKNLRGKSRERKKPGRKDW